MNATSISGHTLSGAGGVQGRHHRGDGGPLRPVADLLGTSVSDLRTQLQGGKSLDDVAQERGVSHDDLLGAIKQGMPQRLKDAPDIDQIAEQIATRSGEPTRPAGAPPGQRIGPPPGPPGDSDGNGNGATGVLGGSMTSSQQRMLDALSSALGTDSGSLLNRLQSGTSLSSILNSNGVDQSTLAGIVEHGLLFDARA